MPSVQETELVGKIQDISRALVMLNPSEQPFVTMVKKGKKPGNTLLEYPIDKYADASSDGVLFNADADSFEDTQENRAMLYSRVMRQWRKPMVDTAAQEITEQAGDDGDKFAQAKAKTTEELKKDMEKTCLGTQDSRAQSGNTPARTRGMACWTNAALQTGDTSATVVPAAFRPDSDQVYTGAFASFTELTLTAMLQGRWDTIKSKGDLVGFIGSNLKSAISDFTKHDANVSGKTLARRYNSDPKELVAMVDVYKGDFGTVKLLPDAEVQSTNGGELIDMNRVEIRALVAPRFVELENKGGGRRGYNETMYALVNTNPAAHCTVQPGS